MIKFNDASANGVRVITSFCEMTVNLIDPLTPVELTAVAVYVFEPTKVGVPVKVATPLVEFNDKSDRRSGDEMEVIKDPPPK